LVTKSDLKDIIKSKPEQFNLEYNAEADYNKLALFILFERLKGDKSFYHPMFAMNEEITTILEWDKSEL
jgi:hypothetical protein